MLRTMPFTADSFSFIADGFCHGFFFFRHCLFRPPSLSRQKHAIADAVTLRRRRQAAIDACRQSSFRHIAMLYLPPRRLSLFRLLFAADCRRFLLSDICRR